MASTVRITPGGGDGGGPPSDEPPGGETVGAQPEGGATGDRITTAPSTQRTPLASGARAAPAAPVIDPAAPVVDPAASTAEPDASAGASGVTKSPTLRLGAPDPVESPTLRLDPKTEAQALPLGASSGGRPQCPECGERFSRGSRFCAFDGTRLVEAAEEAASDPLVGQTLGGKYTVLRPIGEGGMGTVYEVRHNALDRKFALKILRPEISQNGEHIQRFLQEAKAAAAIGHPNIVSVSDFGEHEVRGRAVPFIVMELLRGTSLAVLLRTEKVLSPRRTAKIIADCAEALAAAHDAGVIHRDLKPDNIFLSGDGQEAVKVLDFGVAKMQGTAKRLTKMGMVFGTPHYMSPEQARGQTIDHRADIYALGVILYECLSGHVPFEADTSMGVLTKQIFANPEPIERVAPDPRGLGALGSIVMRCLAKEPDERYGSMAELAEAVRLVLRDPAGAAADSLGGSGRHKRPQLRLRDEAAMPRPAPAETEPAPRQWTRLVAFAAAGVAVLVFVGVSVRTFLLPPGPEAVTIPTGMASSAPASETAAGTTAASAAPPVATGSAAPAAPSVAATGSAAPSPGSSAATTSRPSATGAASGSASTRPAATTSDVLDPWSRPTKKPPGAASGVVDPWAKKK